MPKPDLTWGDSVIIIKDAPASMRPGSLGEVVGITDVDTQVLAATYGVSLGSRVYTIEFGDGCSAEISSSWVKKATEDL